MIGKQAEGSRREGRLLRSLCSGKSVTEEASGAGKMTGPHKGPRAWFSYGAALDRRGRADHRRRRVQARLDFAFVRAAVAPNDGDSGNGSVDPGGAVETPVSAFPGDRPRRTRAGAAPAPSGWMGGGSWAPASMTSRPITACSRRRGRGGAARCLRSCSCAPCGSASGPGWSMAPRGSSTAVWSRPVARTTVS